MRKIKIIIGILIIILISILIILKIVTSNTGNDNNMNNENITQENNENITQGNNQNNTQQNTGNETGENEVNGNISNEESFDDTGFIIPTSNFEEVKFNMEYYAISDIISKINSNIKNLVSNNSNTNIIMDMLSKRYIQEFGITQKNLYGHIKDLINNEYRITSMYSSIIENNLEVFLIYGNIANNKYNYMITVDLNNNTYGVYLNDYIDKYNYNIENINNLKVTDNSIEKNKNNAYTMTDISDNEMGRRYIGDLTYKWQNNLKDVYDILDSDYKAKVFATYEQFNNFFANQKNFIYDFKLDYVEVNNNENYKEYICFDENGNKFIFKVTAVMKYTLIILTNQINYNY